MSKSTFGNDSLSQEEYNEMNLYAYGLEYYWEENISRISADHLTHILFDIHEEKLASNQLYLELTYNILIKLNENKENHKMVSHLREKKEQNITSSFITH